MTGKSFDVEAVLSPEQMAHEIAIKYDQWKRAREPWENRVEELRDFLFATDTSTTTIRKNPFANSTHIPKLSQIAQNLKANYSSHMFSNTNWINWEAGDRSSDLQDKRRVIEAYIRTKARQQNLVGTFEDLLDDWIFTGVTFSRLDYVTERNIREDTGEVVDIYIGPKLVRISPHDIVFNITASDWTSTPKIVRSLVSMGELARMMDENPTLGYVEDLFDKMRTKRELVATHAKQFGRADQQKSNGLIADGFGNILEYYQSDLVEILEFYGDWFDIHTGEYLKNHVITIVDRSIVARKEPIDSWHGRPYLYYTTWRDRPDNLIGMGPLDNLVGMQYKIDKLENLRADVFDRIANPEVVEIGDVEFFGTRGAPGGRYVVETGGNVQHLRPDATALQADLQIAQTLQLMEELAGSPREAMGLRSPGEKTAFEVQVLDNAANRLFRNKVRKFEREMIEPVLNDMLELARRNLNGKDVVRAQDETFGTDMFLSITKDDIIASGKLLARGSIHFEKSANAIQNLNMVFNSQIGQIILPHISKKKLAAVVEDLISADRFDIIQDNIGVFEDVETQRLIQTAQQQLEEEQLTDGSLDGVEQGVEEDIPPV